MLSRPLGPLLRARLPSAAVARDSNELSEDGSRPFRRPAGGLPNADRVMEWRLILPNNHSMDDDDCDHIGECVEGFRTDRDLA